MAKINDAKLKNESLFATMQLEWLLGDWQKLSQVSKEQLISDSEKSHLAIIVASALLQDGQVKEANAMLRSAKDWGASTDLIAKYLISGVQNTLGRANAILNRVEKAKVFFEQSINVVDLKTDSTIAIRLRTEHQVAQLGLKSNINGAPEAQQLVFDNKVEVKSLNQIDLGEAWAGNTVNTVIFRHHALLTKEGFQYTAFYVDTKTIKVVRRQLSDDSVISAEIKGEYNLKDAHNSISLGIDRAGHLHISYDHHGSQLHYRRTQLPHNIKEWSEELGMTGENEKRVTYPSFILPSDDAPLLMLYRDGNWKQGSAYLKAYDETTQQWLDYECPILSGEEQKPWTSNPYWNHPVKGTDGSLHLSYVWRTDYFSTELLINNVNIGYAQSFDNGQSWFSSNMQPYKLPITQVNSEVAWPIPPGSNLINQTSMALDSNHLPHIVFYANDQSGIPQYQHLWFNGKQWQKSQASERTHPFNLNGGGTLQIPISRPDIVMDEQDNVYMIHRGLETKEQMAVTFLPAPDYQYSESNTYIVWDKPLGYAEPIIDRTRWQDEKILSLLLQYNDQPNADLGHQVINSKVTILDIKFNKIN